MKTKHEVLNQIWATLNLSWVCEHRISQRKKETQLFLIHGSLKSDLLSTAGVSTVMGLCATKDGGLNRGILKLTENDVS